MSFYNFAGLGITCVLAVFLLTSAGKRPRDYPPGPPTLPIIGNLHQIPRKKAHLQVQRWAQEYGPIYSLILGTKVLIVLSTDQAVKNLLDKRGSIYSSRPERYIAQDIISGGGRVVLMVELRRLMELKQPYNETLRSIRTLAHRILNINVTDTYIPYQDLENKAMLMDMLERPEAFIDHVRRYTTALTTQMAFGFRMRTMEDPRARQMFDGFRRFNELAGSQVRLFALEISLTGSRKQIANILDIFPVLRHLPDLVLPVRRYAKELYAKEHKLFLDEYQNVKKSIEEGKEVPCFCSDLIRLQQKEGFSDTSGAYISGSFLQAGSETTSAVLLGFVQAMVIFPNVSKMAQNELDAVCKDRLPDLGDLQKLPYVRACVKESLRWMPTDILGVPHAITRDDYYNGYKIPKNAEIIFNHRTIHNDPQRHHNPRIFDPSRWSHDNQTSAEAATNPDVTKRDHFVYGAGRRLCQGMHIADRSMFLAMARLLWAFDFKRVVNEETGAEIVPDMGNLTGGLFVAPEPFEANIVPRDPKKAACVREEWTKMIELLDDEMQWKEYPKDLVWNKV
ncbi:cytochrome P450 protein [Rutstroemia sp. NJR-2017a WRK4]|nr:cytochrome P450 protein [Rutstroemia sp. NJR-2017a WRK4]